MRNRKAPIGVVDNSAKNRICIANPKILFPQPMHIRCIPLEGEMNEISKYFVPIHLLQFVVSYSSHYELASRCEDNG